MWLQAVCFTTTKVYQNLHVECVCKADHGIGTPQPWNGDSADHGTGTGQTMGQTMEWRQGKPWNGGQGQPDLLHQQFSHGQPTLQVSIGGLKAPHFSALGRHLAEQLSILLPLVFEQRPCLLQCLLQRTMVTGTEEESLGEGRRVRMDKVSG